MTGLIESVVGLHLLLAFVFGSVCVPKVKQGAQVQRTASKIYANTVIFFKTSLMRPHQRLDFRMADCVEPEAQKRGIRLHHMQSEHASSTIRKKKRVVPREQKILLQYFAYLRGNIPRLTYSNSAKSSFRLRAKRALITDLICTYLFSSMCSSVKFHCLTNDEPEMF